MDSNSIKNSNAAGYSFSIGIERTSTPTPTPIVSQPEVSSSPPEQLPVSNGYLSASELKMEQSRGKHLKYSDEQFMKMLDRAFKVLDGRNTSIQFQVHDKTNQLVIKVADRDTGEVIREIPPEKSLDFLAKVQEMLGLIVDVRR